MHDHDPLGIVDAPARRRTAVDSDIIALRRAEADVDYTRCNMSRKVVLVSISEAIDQQRLRVVLDPDDSPTPAVLVRADLPGVADSAVDVGDLPVWGACAAVGAAI